MDKSKAAGRHTVDNVHYKSNKRGYNATQQRRKKIKAFYIITIFVVAVVASAVLAGLTLKISSIRIGGSSIYSEDEIIEACPIKVKDGLLSADVEGAAEVICKKLPYIEKAEITRRFPSILLINVEAAEVFCSINQGDYKIIVSDKCKVLSTSGSAGDQVIQVEGITLFSPEEGKQMEFKNNEMEKAFVEMIDKLKNTGFSINGIISINFENLNSITINYEDRISIVLGDIENLEYKLTFAKNILENSDGKGIASDARGTLDFSRATDTDQAVFSPQNKDDNEKSTEESSNPETASQSDEQPGEIPEEDDQNEDDYLNGDETENEYEDEYIDEEYDEYSEE